jgi:hypothetical protein
MGATGREAEKWRYPTLEELRYWNFSTLIQGARGAMYYTYGGPERERRDLTWLEGTLKPAIQEFRGFTDLVRPAWQKQVILSDTRCDQLFMARWKRDEATYLVLVNNLPFDRTIVSSRVLESLNQGELIPWRFTRHGSMDRVNGRVTGIGLKAWEVMVWEVNAR